MAYKHGNLIGKQSIATFLGEDNVKEVVNFALRYIADLDIPIKRGTFVEFRAGMLNISPIGRNCSREERNQYEVLDLVHSLASLSCHCLPRSVGFGVTWSWLSRSDLVTLG